MSKPNQLIIIFLSCLLACSSWSGPLDSVPLYKKALSAGKLTQSQMSLPFFSKEELKPSQWMQKDKYLKKALEQREIPVSVKIEKNKRSKMTITGLGILNIPVDEILRLLKGYKVFGEIKPYVSQSIYDSKQHLLYLKTEAYDYQAHFLFKTHQSVLIQKESSSRVQWKVMAGLFEGMKVNVDFIPLNSRKTKIMLYSNYLYDQISIPEFFLEFGIKVVMQQAALRLRKILESKFNQPSGKASP